MPILNWLTRDDDVKAAQKVPYRLLEEVPELSYGDKDADNMLIQGDNLEALKALRPFYAGQVKCIYIDPPYNTKSAFEHYDDNLEHTKWLAMMWPRLELLRELLSEDGSIWVNIDDNEVHYLKVIMDEVFGRTNFIINAIWQKKFSPQNDAKYISDQHDHILVFAKNKELWRSNKIMIEGGVDRAKNLDNDPRGVWKSVDYTCNKNKKERPNLYYPIVQPNTGAEICPKETAVWRYSKDRHKENVKHNLVYWGKTGENKVPRFKKFQDSDVGQVPTSIFFHQDVGNTQEARKESLKLNEDEPFSTPKPERLLKRIIEISSEPNDIILDSFLGSAGTSAVSHKMGRRHIGIELGEHAVTHCQPRLQKVVDGEEGGISKAVNWQGGGGFRFYRLGANAFDEDGRICPDIRFPVLAAHVWFSETSTPWNGTGESPTIGIHDGKAYALLYNGILGDKRPQGGNVLTGRTLKIIRDEIQKIEEGFAGQVVIYGESSRMGDARLKSENIIFKQTPYDVKAR